MTLLAEQYSVTEAIIWYSDLLKDCKTREEGEKIANEFNMTKPSISNHLNILKQADLVDAEKVGQNVNYSLKTSVLQDVLKLISDLSSRGKD